MFINFGLDASALAMRLTVDLQGVSLDPARFIEARDTIIAAYPQTRYFLHGISATRWSIRTPERQIRLSSGQARRSPGVVDSGFSCEHDSRAQGDRIRVQISHAVCDGLSLVSLVQQLGRAYQGLRVDPGLIPAPKSPTSEGHGRSISDDPIRAVKSTVRRRSAMLLDNEERGTNGHSDALSSAILDRRPFDSESRYSRNEYAIASAAMAVFCLFPGLASSPRDVGIAVPVDCRPSSERGTIRNDAIMWPVRVPVHALNRGLPTALAIVRNQMRALRSQKRDGGHHRLRDAIVKGHRLPVWFRATAAETITVSYLGELSEVVTFDSEVQHLTYATTVCPWPQVATIAIANCRETTTVGVRARSHELAERIASGVCTNMAACLEADHGEGH